MPGRYKNRKAGGRTQDPEITRADIDSATNPELELKVFTGLFQDS